MWPQFQASGGKRAALNKTSGAGLAKIITNGSLKRLGRKGSGGKARGVILQDSPICQRGHMVREWRMKSRLQIKGGRLSQNPFFEVFRIPISQSAC